MKFTVTLPIDRADPSEGFLSADGVAELARTAERLGFQAVSVTDHPVPTGRWLDAGGHHAQDPFVVLAFAAAATTRIRLQTGILVLPYRNPFLTARAVATLDVLSQGRVGLGVGAGYLKREFQALGVDFEARNDLFDEYLRALKAAWTQDEFDFQGTGYEATGAQRPHPPLMIGGNSRRAIRRAAELGDAWMPFLTPAALATTARTAHLADEDELASGVANLRECSEKAGRNEPPAVIVSGLNTADREWSADRLLERIGRFQALGVSGASVQFRGRSPAEWFDAAERFAQDVLARQGDSLTA
jgi:probable F420-dependent oxidoreductase